MTGQGIQNRFWFTDSQQLGFQQFDYRRKTVYPGRLQEEYVIVLCLGGSLRVTERGAEQTVQAGQILIGNSMQWRNSEYGTDGPCEGISLIVSPRILFRAGGFPDGGAKAPWLPVFNGVKNAPDLTRLAAEAREELEDQRPGKADMLDALGREFLIRALRLWKEESVQSPAPTRVLPRRHFVAALDHMQSHGKSDFAVESMCSQIGLNAGDFNRLFRNCTGKTPLQVYNGLLIERAKDALHSGSSSIKEISYQLGFSSPSQFTALFRRITGTCPTERRLHG